MKKTTLFVMALAMVLGLAQCKKEQPETPETQGVTITLNVGGNNNGAKVSVDPYAAEQVTFENGDQILVASGGQYVGTLTRENNVFQGSITNPVEDQPLYFYFLGNKQGTLEAGATTCTVNISDQSVELPVISMGQSTVNYSEGETSYSSRLYNKASLMKFDVNTPSEAAICITGMNNTVTVNFGEPTEVNYGFTYGMDGVGLIKMPAKDANNETWAIVLPQAALAEGEENSAYTADLRYLGTRPAMEEIEMNTFLNLGLDLSVGIANPHFKDLSLLQENLTAQDGDILSGIINGDYKISVADGATVTLMDATIAYPSNNFDTPGIECLGDATICLSGTNVVSCGSRGGYAHNSGIYIHQNKTLTIEGPGSLTIAIPSGITNYGAGIGGGYQQNCGNIVINGGTLDVTGAYAGIGASQSQSCGTITITGGTVTAQGGDGSAGIGTSSSQIYNGSICGLITISGGTVTAIGGGSAAGIGAGWRQSYNSPSAPGNRCAGVDITGGTVTATGGLLAAGIGSGYAGGSRTAYSICGPINITGGIVVATGGNSPDTRPGGAGIGTGYGNKTAVQSQCGAITITTSVTSVTATKGSGATNSIGLGGGYGSCGTVTIGCTLDGEGNPVGGTVGYIEDSPYTYEP